MSTYRRGLEVGRARGRGRPPIRIGQGPKLPLPEFTPTTNIIEANGESQKAFSRLRGWKVASDLMTPRELRLWKQTSTEVIPNTTNDDIARLYAFWDTAVWTIGKKDFRDWWRNHISGPGQTATQRAKKFPNNVFYQNAQMWNGFTRAASSMRADIVEKIEPSYWREFGRMLEKRGNQIYGVGRQLKKAAGKGVLWIAIGLAAVVLVPVVISKAAERRD